MKRIFAAALLALAPSLAFSAPLGPYDEAFFFGDSITDGGAAFDIAGEIGVPSAIYPDGQFTNGDVWATKLGATYVDGTYGSNTGFGTTNFAVGGAEAVAEPDDLSPDLGTQIGVFQNYVNAGRIVPPNSLGLILIGANDFRDTRSLVDPANIDPNDPDAGLVESARNIAAGVINSIVTGTSVLLNEGVSKVAVFGLPDLGAFPSSIKDGLSDFASAFTPEYNASLQAALQAVFTPEQVMFVDTFAIFGGILAEPDAFGITNTTDPCIEDLACLLGDPNSHFFYDDFHPTEVVHDVLADAVQQQFPNPVPIPASVGLLLVGLGSLLVLRGRARTVRT